MKNFELVEIYLRSNQDRESLIESLMVEGEYDKKVLLSTVKAWVAKFRYRWKTSHGKLKFFEKYRDWLDETFMVRTSI